MKRTISLLMVVALLLVFTVSMAPTSAQEEESLLIWGFSDHTEGLLKLAEQFGEEYGVEVIVQELPFDEIGGDVINFGPVGEGPDVFLFFNTIPLVDNGVVAPIDLTGMEDMFHPVALDLMKYQGQTWGVPFAYENVALVRNTDLVPEAPLTWDEVRTVSEEIQASGAADYGFVPMFGDPYHQWPIFSSFGAYVFGETEDGGYDFSDVGLVSEGGLEAAQWLSDFYNDGLANVDMGDEEILELFAQGEIAMFITGPWWSQRVIDFGVPYSIDALPGMEGGQEHGSPFISGYGLFISAFSDNPLLAEAFVLDFMIDAENMKTLLTAEGGAALTRFPAFNDVEITTDPNLAGFMAAGEYAQMMPRTPAWGKLYGAWADAVILIAQGEDPVETMNAAVAQFQAALEE